MARFNFQSFRLRPRRQPRRSKDELSLEFLLTNSRPALEEESISMSRSSRVTVFRFNSKTQRQIFLSVMLRPPCLCLSEGHKHGVSIQISVSLGDTLLRIKHEWKTAETLQGCLHNNHLSQHRLLAQFIEWLRFLVLITWQMKTENIIP